MTSPAPENSRDADAYERNVVKAAEVEACAREEAHSYFESAIREGYDLELPLNCGPTMRSWSLSLILGDMTKESAKLLLEACNLAVNMHDVQAATKLQDFVTAQAAAYSDDHWECFVTDYGRDHE